MAEKKRKCDGNEYKALAARVKELEGDLVRVAQLLGKQFGEPLKSEAVRIATKKQG